jgi:hypothetical protein
MATSVLAPSKNGVLMQTNNHRPNNLTRAELAEIVRKIHALRRVTKTTGFFTSQAIVELLKPLSVEDLIAVGEELKLKPREMPHPTPEINQL